MLAIMLSKPNSGRESTISARELAQSSECNSDSALNEQRSVVSEETRNSSNSINEKNKVQLLENVKDFTGERPEVP